MASPGERSKAESGDDGGGEAEVTVELEPVVVQEAQIMAAQTVDAFNEAIIDCMPEIKRVPYIKGILARMTAVGVAPDLTTYDLLFGALHRKNSTNLRNRNLLDAIWSRETLQSETALELLELMEESGVIPEASTHAVLLQTFGKASAPVLKCRRLVYWMRRFRFVNPFAIAVIPDDPCELAKCILDRIGGKHGETCVITPGDDYVVCSHTPQQEKLLGQLCADVIAGSAGVGVEVCIDGPVKTWFDGKHVNYLVMSCDHGDNAASSSQVLGCAITSSGDAESVKGWITHMANVVDGFDALPLSIRISKENEEEDYGPEDGEIIDTTWTTVAATENIGDINPFSRDSSR